MATIEEARLQVSQAKEQIASSEQNISEVESSLSQTSNQVAEARKVAYSEKYRRSLPGIKGLRERQKAYAGIATAEMEVSAKKEEITRAKADIEAYKQNVSQVEGQISAADKQMREMREYGEGYKLGLAGKTPYKLTKAQKEGYKDARAKVEWSEEKAERQKELQAIKELPQTQNIFISPETIQNVSILKSFGQSVQTAQNVAILKQFEKSATPTIEPVKRFDRLVGGSSAVFDKKSVGSQIIFQPLTSISNTIELALPEKTLVKLDKFDEKYRSNNPIKTKIIESSFGVSEFLASGVLLSPAIGSGGFTKFEKPLSAPNRISPASQNKIFIDLKKGSGDPEGISNFLISQKKPLEVLKVSEPRIVNKAPEIKNLPLRVLSVREPATVKTPKINYLEVNQARSIIKPDFLESKPLFIDLRKSSESKTLISSDLQNLRNSNFKEGLIFEKPLQVTIPIKRSEQPIYSRRTIQENLPSSKSEILHSEPRQIFANESNKPIQKTIKSNATFTSKTIVARKISSRPIVFNFKDKTNVVATAQNFEDVLSEKNSSKDRAENLIFNKTFLPAQTTGLQSAQGISSLSFQKMSRVNELKSLLLKLRRGSGNKIITKRATSPKKQSSYSPNLKTYEIFTKRRGKVVSLGKETSFFKALQTAKSKIRQSLRASFQIKSDGEPINLARFQGLGFKISKKSPFSLVEDRSLRLNTFAEKREIKQSKRKKRGFFR